MIFNDDGGNVGNGIINGEVSVYFGETINDVVSRQVMSAEEI